MTSTVIIHAYIDGTETSGVALATVDEVIYVGLETLAYHNSCYAPCTLTNLPDNRPMVALVTYPNQPFQQQTFSTGVGTTTTLNFYFSASIKGTLTVWGYWDGQEVPVEFTIDGVAGGPWTTNMKLELDAGTYTVRGTWLQQTKVYSATVTAGQNTDLIIQMEKNVYGYVTVESDYQAHVDISDSAGNVIYSLTLPAIPKPEGGYRYGITIYLLPGTYHVHGTYDGQVADQDVTISVAGEGKLVTLVFTIDITPPAVRLIHPSTATGGALTELVAYVKDPESGIQSVTCTVAGTTHSLSYVSTDPFFKDEKWYLDITDITTPGVYSYSWTITNKAGLVTTRMGTYTITDGGGGGELPIGWILMGTGLIILSGAGVYYLWKRKKH